jgi:hypothetical protein
MKFFIHQQMHFLLILENTKIYIKTYIKITPTCLSLRPSSGSLHLSLAKVTPGMVCMMYAVQSETLVSVGE